MNFTAFLTAQEKTESNTADQIDETFDGSTSDHLHYADIL